MDDRNRFGTKGETLGILDNAPIFKTGHVIHAKRERDGDIELAAEEVWQLIIDWDTNANALKSEVENQIRIVKTMLEIPRNTFLLARSAPPDLIKWPRDLMIGRIWAPAVIVTCHPDATFDELREWAIATFDEVEDVVHQGEHARVWARAQKRLSAL